MSRTGFKYFREYWWSICKTSFKKSLNVFLAAATIVGVILFAVGKYMSQETLANLGWQIPLGVFIIAFVINFFWEPASLYRGKENKVIEYETEAIELEPDCRLENIPDIGNVWTARVGVKAKGLKTIRNVFVYLTDIDDSQNEFFDAPLHPFGQFHNATGATNVSPGKTQRFIEVLHWNPSVPEMGIRYHLTEQLREAKEDLKNHVTA